MCEGDNLIWERRIDETRGELAVAKLTERALRQQVERLSKDVMELRRKLAQANIDAAR